MDARSLDLRIKTHKATNRYSAQPVTLASDFGNAPPDMDDRFARLAELLRARSGRVIPAIDPASPELTLCLLAVEFQRAAGLETIRLLELPTGDMQTGPGLISKFPEEPRHVLQALLRVLPIDPSDPRFDATLDRELKLFSDFWDERHNRHTGRTATRMNIPWLVLPAYREPTFVLGHGIHRRTFWRNITPETSRIGVLLSSSKRVTNRILNSIGLPVSEQHLVADADTALTIARRMGWPVVTKPVDSDFGTGITTMISDEDALRFGFAEASRHGAVMVEKQIEGNPVRLLVHQGKFVSATTTEPAKVVGDGIHSVRQLVARENEHRTDGLSWGGKKIKLDDSVVQILKQQGMTLQDVPAKGQAVRLRYQSNLSVGGTPENVTARVHPENRKIAELCAAVLGLDLAGIDLITTDISRPVTETGGAIIEVNATPGLQMGEAENYLEDLIVSQHFKNRSDGRVPIVACIADAASDPGDLAASVAPDTEGAVATVSTDGVTVGQLPLSFQGTADLPLRTEVALANPDTSAVAIVLNPQELLENGLGVDQLSVAVGSPEADPNAREALIVLDRTSAATVIFQQALEEFLSNRKGTGPVWVICPDDTGSGIAGHGVLRYSGGSQISVHPVDGEAYRVDMPPSDGNPHHAPIRVAVDLALSGVAQEGRDRNG